MSSSTVSVTAADTDRSSLIPSLQFHLSPAESTCKSSTTKPDRPNLTLIIPDDQDNGSSDSNKFLVDGDAWFYLLSVLARLHEECEEENDWPVEWVDAAAVTFFFETTVVACYMGAHFNVNSDSDAAVEEHQNRLRKWFYSMDSIPENDQWLEEYKDCVPIAQAFNLVG
ncbi:hypothetical protein FMUND_13046 [Fusarium mundagurra]|uniref:Uncharacterized protein n=1 Tax=Fusarium mundagurra TaxID=1567541 RepID=A0A8H6D5F2_9HYPO|nr:hypothetical protein FMUND_13046 [Fusarium mundagurra]